MDPVSAAAITSLLVTYGRHLAGVAGDVVDEGITKGLRALWDKVVSRFSRNEQASGALERLTEQPDNTRRQAAVEDHLDEIMRTDAAFAAAVAELAEQVAASGYSDIRIRNAGAMAFGGNVTISGARIAAGRDVNVTEAGDDKR